GAECSTTGEERDRWTRMAVAADDSIREIVVLNCVLDRATLVPTTRKPFDVVAEGLVSASSRGDKMAIELFRRGVRGIPDDLILTTKSLATISALSPDIHLFPNYS